MPGPAIVGGLAMGFFGLLGWRSAMSASRGQESGPSP
jgi:hypothetical protein